MKIYFHANNKATLEALQKCGVRNVFLSHKYSHNISTFSKCFDDIFISSGVNDDQNKYYEFLENEKGHYTKASQFFIPNDMNTTYDIYKHEKDIGLKTIPVLQEDYMKHLSLLNLPINSNICVGKMKGRFDTEDSIKKLPTNNNYHGLGKGKFIQNSIFSSIDTSLWISAAMAKKFDIWHNGTIIHVDFRKDSKPSPVLKHYCEEYKDYMDMVGINWYGVESKHYYSLLKLPIALYYMPLCKHLNSFSDNFIK